MTAGPARPLGRLLAAGTTVATCVLAVGAALAWTPWHPAGRVVILVAAGMFAALPVAGLVLLAVSYLRRRDLLYVGLTGFVLAVVVVDTVVGGRAGG